MKTFNGITELKQAAGTHLGYSNWHTITQDQIDAFADATGDHQWIHVDPHGAAQGPFGTTIAHGYLVVSLIPMLTWQVYDVQGIRMGINYGSNKIRFPDTVPVGSRVRAAVALGDITETNTGVQVISTITIERELGVKPVCVAEIVSLLLPAQTTK